MANKNDRQTSFRMCEEKDRRFKAAILLAGKEVGEVLEGFVDRYLEEHADLFAAASVDIAAEKPGSYEAMGTSGKRQANPALPQKKKKANEA